MGLINAESFRQPYGAPAIHVSSEAGRGGAGRGGARRTGPAPGREPAHPAVARNVVIALAGTDPAAPLVVMTPRSSWWQSTSERGGGIVCWLESLRALLAAPPVSDAAGRPVIFTANSGHELGHLGLDDFVARRARLGPPAA